MRAVVPLLLIASPVAAWEFAPLPVCTLWHEEAALSVRVTFDPSLQEAYAIALTRTGAAWPPSPSFAIRFDGPAALTIGTDRHRLSEDGGTLTVSDSSFGNVLDGIEFNDIATAAAGAVSVPFTLDGAAPEVRAFRDCGVVAGS